MSGNFNGVLCDLNMEKLEQLVENINAKWTSLQRQVEHITQNQTPIPCESAVGVTSHASSLSGSCHRAMNNSAVLQNETSPHSSFCRTYRATYWGERELFLAASDLCLCLNGGVNYRTMFLQSQRLIELSINMIREDIALIREVDILPAGVLQNQFNVFHNLFNETKKLFAQYGILKTPRAMSQADEEEEETLKISLYPELNSPLTKISKRTTRHKSRRQNRIATGSFTLNESNTGITSNSRQATHVTISTTENREEKREKFAPLCLSTSIVRRLTEDMDDFFIVEKSQKSITSLNVQQKAQAFSSTQSEPDMLSINDMDTTTNRNSPLQCLENLYLNIYESKGENMIADLVRIVLKREYENRKDSSNKPSFSQFRRELEMQLMSTINAYNVTKEKLEEEFTLVSEYMENCRKHKVTPCNVVSKHLDHVSSGKDAFMLSLTHKGLGDDDVLAFAPLLPRVPSLQFLDLSYNNIHDTGMSAICSALQHHACLEVIDISGNPITDTSAAALLRLTDTAVQMKAVIQRDVNFGLAMREALCGLSHIKQAGTHASYSRFRCENVLTTPVTLGTDIKIWLPKPLSVSTVSEIQSSTSKFSRQDEENSSLIHGSSPRQAGPVLRRVCLPRLTVRRYSGMQKHAASKAKIDDGVMIKR